MRNYPLFELGDSVVTYNNSLGPDHDRLYFVANITLLNKLSESFVAIPYFFSFFFLLTMEFIRRHIGGCEIISDSRQRYQRRDNRGPTKIPSKQMADLNLKREIEAKVKLKRIYLGMSQEKMMEGPVTPGSQEFILKDEGTFISNVSRFYNQESLSDIKLNVGNKVYFGHKFVLAKSSDVFRTMLYESRWKEKSTASIDLNESAECQAVFNRFLRYLYTAEIKINPESAVGVLCLADKYNVASLKHLCTKYMVENTKSPKVQNALNWYSWAKALHLEDLIEQCAKTIAWNADNIIKSPEWLTMDNDFVTDLLQSSSLVVTNEYTLYLALTHWLEHQETLKPNSYGENVQKLMSFIRFPQMLVSQLYDIENSEISKMPEYRTLMHHLISKAYRFRSLCPAQKELKVSFNEPFYIPRDYKELMVDSVRMHNTHRFGIQVDVRTYVGPVPSEIKEGDWKITYRKNADQWILQIFCHESALVQGEARVMSSLIVYNDDEEVIQVEQSTPTVCSRGNHMSHTIDIINPEVARTMAVLIKPVPI
ncbi:galectin-3-binding protein B isoform X2 [Octopus bimaculoides]|uniref:galectin-3-binding protein B isoform X2 n=2 Tax=Octopus bimaculoides TaxID=37653 RepID=UPI00071C9870|nr:galectin-3-binding protein B isoform X2 [Octopus bimaculoides]|eukprot:XP_014778075.1 PREDICTED: galectin-3-binding protein B-like isoform X2 [Octopus bimaculoides]